MPAPAIPIIRFQDQPAQIARSLPIEQCAGVVGQVSFAFDSAALMPVDTAELDRLVNRARACGVAGVNIIGHTDRTGNSAYNLDLSQQRSDAVAAFFKASLPALAPEIDGQGLGEGDPAAVARTLSAAAENRRVVISFTPSCPAPGDVAARIRFAGDATDISPDDAAALTRQLDALKPDGSDDLLLNAYGTDDQQAQAQQRLWSAAAAVLRTHRLSPGQLRLRLLGGACPANGDASDSFVDLIAHRPASAPAGQ